MSSKIEKCVILMVTTDLSQKQIAEELNVSEQTIINWKKKDEYKELEKKIPQNF